MKRSIIVGNWKMYLASMADAHILATSVRNGIEGLRTEEIILCPPSIWLSEIAQIVGRGKIQLGAQNMFYECEGAFTGETSPEMIKEMGKYVIVGHSERRKFFGENDLDINEKTIAAVKAGLTPIVCVGENKKSEKISEPIDQLKKAISSLPKTSLSEIIVAYEPIWAITSKNAQNNAEPEYVAKVMTKLREYVHRDTPVIYGGSVKPGNIQEYAKRPEIDGVLVGSASVVAKDFIAICKSWAKIKNFK